MTLDGVYTSVGIAELPLTEETRTITNVVARIEEWQ